MTAPRNDQDADEPGFTEQGEAAEQAAFRGDGEYSGGGFAAGDTAPSSAEGEQPSD